MTMMNTIELYQQILTMKAQVNTIQTESEKVEIYIRIRELHKQLPAKFFKSQIFRVVAQQGNLKCFYTGLACHLNIRNPTSNDWNASVEHLHPKKFGGGNEDNNLVVAAKFVNNMLGNAPLEVKLDIREKLHSLKFLPNVTMEHKTEIIKNFVREELDSYRIDGIPLYPWDWENVRHPEWMYRLKNRNDLIMRLFK
jgi:hypothetical protein